MLFFDNTDDIIFNKMAAGGNEKTNIKTKTNSV